MPEGSGTAAGSAPAADTDPGAGLPGSAATCGRDGGRSNPSTPRYPMPAAAGRGVAPALHPVAVEGVDGHQLRGKLLRSGRGVLVVATPSQHCGCGKREHAEDTERVGGVAHDVPPGGRSTLGVLTCGLFRLHRSSGVQRATESQVRSTRGWRTGAEMRRGISGEERSERGGSRLRGLERGATAR